MPWRRACETVSSDGYTFLVRNYLPGDKIYLFGFSRGAFTARVLAALVHSFGLLERRNENLAPYLWQTISDFASIALYKDAAKKIKADFAIRHDVEIEFMGLFDTVSSVGVFERFKVFPYTDKNASVRRVRHAVSIHEQRNGFPELLLIPDGNDVAEIWFPGVHRDIGGGGEGNQGYSSETLRWIVEEAARAPAAGAAVGGSGGSPAQLQALDLDQKPEPNSPFEIHRPLFDPYVLIGLYPMKMFDYSLQILDEANWSYSRVVDSLLGRPTTKDSGFRWFWPNFKHQRQIPKNAFVFDAVGQAARDGLTIDMKQVQCTEGPRHDPPRYNFAELAGIVLGVALSVLLANRGMHGPLDEKVGPSWPACTSVGAFFLFFAYLAHQAFSQWLSVQERWKSVNVVVPPCGVIATAALAIWTWTIEPWWMLLPAAGFGVAVAAVALAGRLPILKAVRVIPLFIVPWVAIIAGLWAVPRLVGFLYPWFVDVTDWLFNWRPELNLFPTLDYVAWVLAVITGLSGLSQISQDRRKMG